MRALVLVVALLLVMLLLSGGDIAEPDDAAVQVKAVQQWGSEKPPYIVTADMFTTTTTARARTAPTKRTTVHTSSVGAPATVMVTGTNWTDNKHQPPAGHWSGAINGAPCGGSALPSCSRVWTESKGDPRIWNRGCYAPVGWTGSRSPCGGSTASGAYQFVRGTWGNYRGYVNAADAPLDVQIEKAKLAYAGGAGCFHWQDC